MISPLAAAVLALTWATPSEPPLQRPTVHPPLESDVAVTPDDVGTAGTHVDSVRERGATEDEPLDPDLETPVAPPESSDDAPPAMRVDSPPPVPSPASGPPRPQPRASIPPPLHRGTGMLVSAGVLAAAGIGTKIAFTLLDRANGYLGLSIRYIGQFPNLMMGSALGLLGGGMAKRGQWAAHQAMFADRSPRMRPRPLLGWLLFGAGVAVWATTRAGHYTCVTLRCELVVLELGWYGSLALSASGIALAGYGTGFRLYERRFRHVTLASIAPVPLPRGTALSLTGNF